VLRLGNCSELYGDQSITVIFNHSNSFKPSFSNLIFHNHSHTVKRRQSISPFTPSESQGDIFFRLSISVYERDRGRGGWRGHNVKETEKKRESKKRMWLSVSPLSFKA